LILLEKVNLITSLLYRQDKKGKNMEKIIKELVDIATDCEKNGLVKEASNIDNISQSLLNIKTAQYVGIQGYWIRNERCWSNCYRIKRTTKPKLAAQEVWQECQKEYVESINNDKSGWEKYAEDNKEDMIKKFASVGIEKIAHKIIADEKKFFNDNVQNKVKGGLSFESAVFSTIKEATNKYSDDMLNEAENILIIAKKASENGQKELSKKLAKLSLKIVKEAQGRGFWGGVKGLFQGKEKNMMARIRSLAQDIARVQNAFSMGQVDVRYMDRAIQQLKSRIAEDLQVTVDLASKDPDNYMLQQLHRQVRDVYTQLTTQVEPAVKNKDIKTVTQYLGQMSNYIQNTAMKDFSNTNQLYQNQQARGQGGGQAGAGSAQQVVQTVSSPVQVPFDINVVIDYISNKANINDPNDKQILDQISSAIQGKMTAEIPQQTQSLAPIATPSKTVSGTPARGKVPKSQIPSGVQGNMTPAEQSYSFNA
jgi:hypothetical protein